MYKKNKRFISPFYKSSILKKISPNLLVIFIFSCLVYFTTNYFPNIMLPLNLEVFALIGISLAIFLGFCNNTAYQRFKEGKKQWANLTTYSRSLTFQILNLIEEDSEFTYKDKQEGVKIIIGFCYTLNNELKNNSNWAVLQPILSNEMYKNVIQKRFKSAYLLNELTSWVNHQFEKKRIDSITCTRINQNIEELSKVLGVCEHIADTKIPFVYLILLHRTIYIYCFILPFGLLESMSWMMPFFVLFVSYTFISLNAVVAEIAEPFGEKENDLALNQMCIDINESLNELSGLTLIPDNEV